MAAFACDGSKENKCSETIQANSTRYVCPHYNLAILYPELLEEYNPDLNGGLPLSSFLPNSNKKLTWVCRNHTGECDCHIWMMSPNVRTGKGKMSGCPVCTDFNRKRICPDGDNNLAGRFPHLIAEWHPDNEGTPYDYTFGMLKMVKWRCQNCPSGDLNCHVWEATITSRVDGGNNCPFCGGNNCPFCGGNNCPFCGGRRLCLHSPTLLSEYPEIAAEWHPDNEYPPEHYSPHSTVKVKWRCQNCPSGDPECHVWESRISDRTKGHGCHSCSKQRPCKHTSLVAGFPKLIRKEWHHEKNTVDPSTVTQRTQKKYWWKCLNPKCGIDYLQAVTSKTVQNCGCPHCYSSKGEKFIAEILTKLDIKFERQFGFVELPGKRFDFVFKRDKRQVIIEYDGGQHFKKIDWYHKGKHTFARTQYRDILKHLTALTSKYNCKIIRISYKIPRTKEDIKAQILEGLECPCTTHFSNMELYDFLIKAEKDFNKRQVGLSIKEEFALCRTVATEISGWSEDMK